MWWEALTARIDHTDNQITRNHQKVSGHFKDQAERTSSNEAKDSREQQAISDTAGTAAFVCPWISKSDDQRRQRKELEGICKALVAYHIQQGNFGALTLPIERRMLGSNLGTA